MSKRQRGVCGTYDPTKVRMWEAQLGSQGVRGEESESEEGGGGQSHKHGITKWVVNQVMYTVAQGMETYIVQACISKITVTTHNIYLQSKSVMHHYITFHQQCSIYSVGLTHAYQTVTLYILQ